MVLDGKFLKEYPVNAGDPRGSILGPTLLTIHLPGDVICNNFIYADDSVIRHLFCGNK